MAESNTERAKSVIHNPKIKSNPSIRKRMAFTKTILKGNQKYLFFTLVRTF